MRAFGVTPESRRALVGTMLASHVKDAAMYWLLLVLATGIAMLGLALGSSAVVLGAMLISPLIVPIVGLGMGLAVGSPVLVARSFIRVAISVAVVVGGATAITLILPFHEVTAPIAARTSPTALDLLVSICCALVASFVTVAARNQASTTAAGTAVAIALVPPLCVVGFGLGTEQLGLARGAGLLFVASFSAITLFAVLTFTLFGFGELDATTVEEAVLSQRGGRSIAVDRVRPWLGGRSGGLLRLVLPLLLFALVYLPLRRALEEVAWEVRARQAIGRELDGVAKASVRTSIAVAQHRIHLDLILLGAPAKAATVQRTLEVRLAAATGVVPEVHVLAVPDTDAMREAMASVPREVVAAVPVAKTPVVPVPDLRESTMRLAQAMARAWPAQAAGPLVTWHLDTGSGVAAQVEVVHFGTELGPAAEQMLAGDLSDAAGEAVSVRDVVLPSQPVSLGTDKADEWFAEVAPLLDEVSRYEGLFACVGVPAAVKPDAIHRAVTAAAARVPDARAQVFRDARWTFRVQAEACPAPEIDAGTPIAASEAPSDAGPGDASQGPMSGPVDAARD